MTPKERLELLRREEGLAEQARNTSMNDAIREAWAEHKAARRFGGPPPADVVVAMRNRLRKAGKEAGYLSVCRALRADGWTISEATVRRRLTK